MQEIRREWHEEDGQGFEVFATDITDHNILEVAAGSTGPAEEKWDIKTYIRIRDNGGTNMKVIPGRDGVELKLQGWAELNTLIRGLKFITKALEDARDQKYE